MRHRRAVRTTLAATLVAFVPAVIAYAQAPSARSMAQARVAEVSASAIGAPSVSVALESARQALKAGEEARAAHDDAYARIAEETALEWAETAHALQAGDAFEARSADDSAAASIAIASASAAASRLDEALARRAAMAKSLAALDAELAARPLPLSTSARGPKRSGAKAPPGPSLRGATGR